MQTRVILVRHAQTVWNRQGRLQGQKNSPLTDTGIKQAQHIGSALSTTTIHKAYVSSLGRARETIKIILHGRDVEVVAAENLQEIGLGPWEGKTREEARAIHPEQYDFFWNHQDRFALQGAETYARLQNRVVREIHGIFLREKGKQILVVSHWIAIKVAIAFYASISLARLSTIPDPGNGSYSVLTRLGNGEILAEEYAGKQSDAVEIPAR